MAKGILLGMKVTGEEGARCTYALARPGDASTVVHFEGSCALSAQIRSILSTLVDVLRTPSSDVQRAVSDCLESLMAILASDESFIVSLIDRVQGLLLKGASYGDRSALCTRGIQQSVTNHIQDRWSQRQSVLVLLA